MLTLACKTPRGAGGMGAHFDQVIREAIAGPGLHRYYSTAIPAPDAAIGVEVNVPASRRLARYSPLRFSPGWRHFIDAELFDRAVARTMACRSGAFGGFAGQNLHAGRAARRLGCESVELHSPTAHAATTLLRYELAARQWGIESAWLNPRMVRKQTREYEESDIIHVNSEYVRQSFLDHGIPDDKLRRTYLVTNPRFADQRASPNDGRFRIVYTGSMTVTKGVPVLVEAFRHFSEPDAELVLIGGWSTRGMRRYLEGQLARDHRIRLASGDPLPILVESSVYVHPSYQDGYGYAPMEALLCGVKVVVTEDTGMKENVEEGRNGYVVETGSWEAILEKLETIRRGT